MIEAMEPERTPPHDIKAEVCVIGAIMIDAKAVTVARETLTEDSFYRPAHQTIFRVLCWMADHPAKWGLPDLVTVRAAMRERGCLESVGGVEYLIEMVEGVPSAANISHYAGIVAEMAQRRAVIIAGTQAANEAFGTGDTGEIVAQAVTSITQAGRRRSKTNKTSAAEVAANMEAAIAGDRRSIQWPWACVTRWAKACAPGAVCVVCGEPGAGKSWWLQEAMLFWHRQGVKTAMMQLEKNRAYHQARALGQLDGNSPLVSDEWQENHPQDAREALERHRELLDSYGAAVWDDPDGEITLDEVQQWIAARIGEGARIVGVDPITAASSGSRPWESDRKFIVACQAMASRAGASILLVTHPRNAQPGPPSLDALAGGRAYGRLSDCVMWLQGHNPPIDSDICGTFGPDVVAHNRTLTLCKTRDGTGQGLKFALNFDPETLATEQVGTIKK